MPTDLSRLTFGQPYASLALAQAVDNGRLGHAYLLHGPSMVGKSTLALAFGRALLCDEVDRPCGRCRSCQDCERGAHPDLRIIAPGSGDLAPRRAAAARSAAIGIDQVREMRLDSVLAPVRSQWRVIIIQDADHLTAEAMNALLKTLEEPPAHVVLVLTAERLDALLPTVISRCQVIRLNALPRDVLAQTLVEHWQLDESRARQLAAISRGRIGWAVRTLAEPALLNLRIDALDRLRALLRDGTMSRLDAAALLADRYGKDRDTVLGDLGDWLGWWRDALLFASGSAEAIANVDREDELSDCVAALALPELRGAIEALWDAVDNLACNVNPRLAFEKLVLNLPQPRVG